MLFLTPFAPLFLLFHSPPSPFFLPVTAFLCYSSPIPSHRPCTSSVMAPLFSPKSVTTCQSALFPISRSFMSSSSTTPSPHHTLSLSYLPQSGHFPPTPFPSTPNSPTPSSPLARSLSPPVPSFLPPSSRLSERQTGRKCVMKRSCRAHCPNWPGMNGVTDQLALKQCRRKSRKGRENEASSM